MTEPEEWTTSELFEYCQTMKIISEEDKFEDWMNDRTDMLKFVKDDLDNL